MAWKQLLVRFDDGIGNACLQQGCSLSLVFNIFARIILASPDLKRVDVGPLFLLKSPTKLSTSPFMALYNHIL
jgi:hypothetical protein